MIKFFRKIRQKTLTENKFSKYLLYAIGEIILVVIGILIALQINNWNENRKNQILEKKYLENMLIDLNGDVAFTRRNIISRYDRKLAALEIGKSYWQGNYKITDTLSFLNEISYGGVFGNIIWAFERTTYNVLVNSGGFPIIQNDTLRKEILNYYGLQNRVSESTIDKQSGYIAFTSSKAPFDRNNINFISKFDQVYFLKKISSEEFYELSNLEITLAHKIKNNADLILNDAENLIDIIGKQLNQK